MIIDSAQYCRCYNEIYIYPKLQWHVAFAIKLSKVSAVS